MNVLITGGAGYLGVVLSKALLDKGCPVTILDNFIYGESSILHLMEYPGFDVIREDLRNINGRSLARFDVIYHLAGISGYPACEANPNSAQLINVDATRQLTGKLSRDQILIYASTTSFYGMNGDRCDEDSHVAPVSLYGKTKYQGEQIVMQKENSIALRFATIFGVSPKMRVDLLVNDFTCKAINDRCIVLFAGDSKRTFVHIKDAIRAYIFAMEHAEDTRNKVFNVGDERLNYSKIEIAETISGLTGCKVIKSDMDDLDVRNFEISFEKIRALGYSVQHTLMEGIQELIRLYTFYKPFLPYKPI